MIDYIEKAMRTNTDDGGPLSRILQDNDLLQLMHACIGVSTEAGELIDPVKKAVFYGASIDKINLMEEVGDVLWYCAIILRYTGHTFDDAMERNISKLQKRYPDKFTEENATKRDLKKERIELEKVRII